ncbi:MAG: lipopolysaccharide transport periplasmic protein LptA [Acidovorax sp.]|jgi:lipopolysaccharide export system protein LptA|nr:lipopolysaccharide transport periplasmic protein LptA [Acidovorax sp.]
MTRKLLPLLLLAALAGAMGPAQAEKADRNKPMNIEADALHHDELQQVSTFTGNVVLTKGTIVLRGAKLEVRQDAEGYQFGKVWAEKGKRAFFRQKRDTLPGAPEEFVEGEGEIIEYDGKKDDVRLIQRGQLRRYTGGTLSDDITGTIITYNNLTDVFTVDGNRRPTPGSAEAANSSGSRVRAVLVPKTPPAAAPAASTKTAPALQSSDNLTPRQP